MQETGVQSLGGERRRTWQPTPVFLPGESHGLKSRVGYSPQACKELDETEVTEHTCTRGEKVGFNIRDEAIPGDTALCT